MAEPIELPQTNHTWFGPEGSDIKPLPAILHENTSTTVWKLTPEELASVLATGCVGVQVTGRQPPMAVLGMTIEQPEDQPPFYITAHSVGTAKADTMHQALAILLATFAQGDTFAAITTTAPAPRCPVCFHEPGVDRCRLPAGHQGLHEFEPLPCPGTVESLATLQPIPCALPLGHDGPCRTASAVP